MSLLTPPAASIASTTLLRKPDSLRVRVSAGAPGRIVPLDEGKTTIGSSPQCVVVLPATDCRPLQCVVALDVHRAEATRWGAGVQLNGRDFSKAVVAVGDKLTVGRYELEFATSQELDDASEEKLPAELPEAAVANAPKSTPTTQLDVEGETVDRLSDLFIADPAATAIAKSELPPETATAPPLPAPTAETQLQLPPSPASMTTAPVVDALSSHVFADELILRLWQGGDRSRRRAKALADAARDARQRTDAMAADLAAMEVELDLARAAYDSHAANHEQLQLELIERDRRSAERVGPLAAEVETLHSQLQDAQLELAEQAARCNELNAALELRESTATSKAIAAEAESARAAELEQSLAVQIEQATLLSRELGVVHTELDGVRAELETQAARRRELEDQVRAAGDTSERLKQSTADVAERDHAIAQLRGELEWLQAERAKLAENLHGSEQERLRLADLRQTATDRVAALEQAITDREAASTETPSVASIAEAAPLVTRDDDKPSSVGELAAAIESVDLQAWTPVEEQEGGEAEAAIPALAKEAVPEPSLREKVSNQAAPPLAIEIVPVASEPASNSFIDKYRHLLDDDDCVEASSAPPMLDDEYLSPAKAADRTIPADDSDEALDAYMASMMQRMRSHSSPSIPIQEPIEQVVEAPESPPLDYDPSVPFEIESMKQGRRPAASTDLTALREIANTSARSAIATHRKRRKVESAIGKVIVATIALSASAFLMWSAPSLYDWQFSTGAVVGLIGLGSAALAMRHGGNSAADHRVDANYFAADESTSNDV